MVHSRGHRDHRPRRSGADHTRLDDRADRRRHRYLLDGVVTTVGAVNGAASLDRQPEAVKQTAVADRLLLTKTDLAKSDRRQALEARLAALNPSAPLIPVAQGVVDPARLFNLGFFDLATKSVDVQRWLRDYALAAGHHHHQSLLHHSRASDFMGGGSGWLDGLAAMRGEDTLRFKAIVALSDRPDQPVVLHGVQRLFHPPVLLPQWPSADSRTRVVFITRDLPQEAIEAALTACEQGNLSRFIEIKHPDTCPANLRIKTGDLLIFGATGGHIRLGADFV